MKYVKTIGLLIAAACLAGSESDAAETVTGHGYPFITNISAEEYDGHVQNWGFATDDEGMLFVANIAEVLRYDGVRWHTISVPNTRTFSIASDNEGTVYVGGAGEFGYISRSSRTHSRDYEYVSLVPEIGDTLNIENVWGVVAADPGVFFHSNRYVFFYDGEDMYYHDTDTRFSVLYERDGDVYTRESEKGIKKVRADTLIEWKDGRFFADRSLMGYMQTENGEFYCSFRTCYEYRDGVFREFDHPAADYLEQNGIDNTRVLSDGTMMIATRNGGIVQLTENGELLRTLNDSNGLPSNAVYGSYEDATGSVWLATVNGISRVDMSLPFRRYDRRYGLSETLTNVTMRNDTLFLASASGAYTMKPGDAARIHEGMTFCREFLHHHDELYMACTEGVFRYGNEGFERKFTDMRPRALGVMHRDTLVGGSHSDIYITMLNEGDKEVLYRFGGTGHRINSVKVCSNNYIWMGTETDGLYRFRLVKEDGDISGHEMDRFIDDQERQMRVYVTEIGGETVFLTTDMGMMRYDAERDSLVSVRRYGELFAEPGIQVFWAEEDSNGNVWFRADERYMVARLLDDGTYDLRDGQLRRIDDRQSSALYADDNGHIWFATEKGLVRHDPGRVFDENRQYHTKIGDVLVRGDSLVYGGERDDPLVLDYEDNDLRFTYSGLSYHQPERIEYRTKLEGFDGDWLPWSDEVQKDYTNIPEGRYRFLVESRNVYGVTSAAVPYHLEILPPWYRTWWAYLIYFVTGSLVIYAGYRIRLHQVTRVHRIRNNIASDLHDEISATLSSISFFARAIENDKISGDKSRFVSLISQSAGDAKEKITDIVWAINPEHDDWRSFASKCRRFASDCFESHNIDYDLDVDDNIPGRMDMQVRKNLWLIFKEMLTNAVRHSGARYINVVMTHSGSRLRLVVADNGKGFDSANKTSGNGLTNIRQRTEQIGGRLKLDTRPGNGTRWELTLRL